ncbi:hypothetical protein SAMD00023353_6100270 [Rosellinia necatrix]|uniref:Uncharacterized protein n=1 Tax=Rosellinia necatrix TaxID=77044 RepID=A0A1S8AAD8_ROSNE|nr:hypothetical protein SAMD00023353_6100270 [Rosellinia necatrix]
MLDGSTMSDGGEAVLNAGFALIGRKVLGNGLVLGGFNTRQDLMMGAVESNRASVHDVAGTSVWTIVRHLMGHMSWSTWEGSALCAAAFVLRLLHHDKEMCEGQQKSKSAVFGGGGGVFGS